MSLSPIRTFLFFVFLISANVIFSQGSGFDSFISRISATYNVDLALAPELIPTLDSIRNFEPGINNIEALLHKLLDDKNISYQIIDGNKLMLRRESGIPEGMGLKLLKGTIVDGDGAPLSYAAVSLMDTNHGSFSDEDGNFLLEVKDTTGSVIINYLGFKPVTIPIKSFTGEKPIVRMELNTIPLKQVVIVVPFQEIAINGTTQSIDLRGYQFISEKQLLNGNAENLINNLTGYTHYSSEAGIRLRGSEAENSLIVMDGLPVYDPYHFYNIFSAFNGHYFSSVELYKNNMPIEYGGRIDGLIDINSDHDSPGSNLIFDTDLLLTSLTGDWEISPRVQLTAGGRVSHTGILNEALKDSVSNFSIPGQYRGPDEWSTSQQPTFNFYDINAGLHFDIGNRSDVMVSYFKNEDHLDNVIQTDFETTFPGPGNEFISVQQSIFSKDKWSNEGASIDIRSRLHHKSMFNFNGFISSFDKSSSYFSSRHEHRPNINRNSYNTGIQESHLQTAGMKAFISSDSSSAYGYKVGIDLQRYEVDLLAEEDKKPYLNEAQREYESTLFGEHRFAMVHNLDWTLGARFTYLNSTSHIYPQPHLQINYLIDDHWKLKSSFSKNIQALQEVTVENRFGKEVDFLALSQPEEGYPILKSDKYMTGVNYSSNNLSVDAELFYKKINGLINVRALNPNPSHDQTSPGEFYRLFTGDGWTAGLDLLIMYKKNNLESSISYTLSKISEKFDRLFNGKSFSPEEDRRHQLKFSSQYKMGKFTAASLVTYKTRAPYLSFIKLENNNGGIGMVDQGTVIRYLPLYFSLDLGLDYSFSCFKQSAQIGVSLINATNHKNINDLQHVGFVSKDGGMGGPGGVFLTNETELLGRTVNVHFRFLLQ
jgi:hypothetical protein